MWAARAALVIGAAARAGTGRVFDQTAATTSLKTASMSSAFSFVKGRGMSRRERTFFSPTLISKQPLRGLSGLITQVIPLALSRDSSFAARVLNAPQLLQASMTT